jgi:hypothetical protein
MRAILAHERGRGAPILACEGSGAAAVVVLVEDCMPPRACSVQNKEMLDQVVVVVEMDAAQERVRGKERERERGRCQRDQNGWLGSVSEVRGEGPN